MKSILFVLIVFAIVAIESYPYAPEIPAIMGNRDDDKFIYYVPPNVFYLPNGKKESNLCDNCGYDREPQ